MAQQGAWNDPAVLRAVRETIAAERAVITFDVDTCLVCTHPVDDHDRSGCLTCPCVEHPSPWDPQD